MHTPASTGSFVQVGAVGSDDDFEQLGEEELLASGEAVGAAAPTVVDTGPAAAEAKPEAAAPERGRSIAAAKAPASSMSSSGMEVTSNHDVEADIRQLEAQATKVAQEVQRAAVEYTHKLTAGFKSALGGLGAQEPPSLTRIAGALGSWFLETPSQAVRQGKPNTGIVVLPELLGLQPNENLVEAFKCKLLQTYGCTHNSYTPSIQMAFQGTLYITDQHVCFTVEERSHTLPIKVQHRDVKQVTRQRPQPKKGEVVDVLRLDLQKTAEDRQDYLAFKDFEAGTGSMESALALVEHLTTDVCAE